MKFTVFVNLVDNFFYSHKIKLFLGGKMSQENLKNMSFEEALEQLDALVRDLEGGRIKLDDAVEAYDKAVGLKKLCEEKLKAAELKVEKIEAAADGTLKTEPLDKIEDHA